MKIKFTQGIQRVQEVGPIVDAGFRMQSFDEQIANVRNVLKLDDAANNYSVIGAYTSIYQKISAARQRIIQEVDEISETSYLVNVVVSQIVEDALAPEIGTGNIFSIKYPKNPKIEKILQKLEKDLNLDEVAVNIMPDVLKYGEYTLETKIEEPDEYEDELNQPFDVTSGKKKVLKKSKGLLAIRDVVEQGTVVAITQDTETTGYLALTLDKRQIVKRAPNKYVKFILGGSRKRIKLEDFVPQMMTSNKKVQEILKTLPRYVRIGRSVIHPFITKFKELDLLEKLVPATKLSKLSNVNLVGVQVPAKYDINNGFEVARRMENYINNKVGVDNRLGEITVESILSVAGRTKVLPLFGDKGSVEKIDHHSDEPDELLSSVKDTREVILDSIGVPYELIYKSESESKAETLKRYAKYLRKLKNVQRTVAEGMKDICAIHLNALGVTDYDLDDIEIEFRNKLIEIDNLDRLEHADVTISFLNNIQNFFNDISAPEHPMHKAVNLDAVAAFIDRNLKTIGLADAINTVEEGGKSVNRTYEDPKDDDEDELDPDLEPDSEDPDSDDEKELDNK
jgi:hypothetical protein